MDGQTIFWIVVVVAAVIAWACFDAANFMDEQDQRQEVAEFNAAEHFDEDGWRHEQRIIDGTVVPFRHRTTD